MNVLWRGSDPGSDDGRKQRRGTNRGNGPSRGRTPVPVPPGRPFRTLAFWALVVLLSLVAYRMYQGSFMTPQRVDLSYTRFIDEVNKGNIANMQIIERTVTGELKSEAKLSANGHDTPFKTFKTNILGDGVGLPEKVWLTNPNIEIEVRTAGVNWLSLLFTWLPLVMIFGAWLFLLRQMQAGGSAALKFGKTKARVLLESTPKVTFKDVAGCDEAKQELQEIIEFLKEPQKFQRLGGRIPKGALLLGPPGSGKTLLAKAVAGEAGVPFFSMSGSDFVEMFVGVGASVTGDTPILVRHEGQTRLVPIGEFVDSFYAAGAEGVVAVEDVETLGFDELDSKFKGSSKTFVKGSAWKRARGVFRHRVNEIHEIRYLGGTLRTTGDHSVFVRTRDGIKSVAARDLKPGDVLVQLPLKVRGEYSADHGTPHTSRTHAFPRAEEPPTLRVVEHDAREQERYAFAVEQRGQSSQAEVAAAIGASQMTVSNWQTGKHEPRALSTRYSDHVLPEQVELSPRLMKLLGYYTAEGRGNGCLEFTFGTHEPDLYNDALEGVREIFGVEGVLQHTADNSTKVVFYSAPLGRFFERLCGTGSKNKHVPDVLWDLPREYFEAYLTGYALGDGYVSTSGKLSVTSVSHTLIRELAWLCAMHGIPAGIPHTLQPAGRVIKSKPLPAGEAWNLIIGKTRHWLARDRERQGKRAIVRSVTVVPYDGFVYDLCGCDNEAFFGGEKPVLLHNSRVRDLFEQGKRNAPCLTGDTVVTLTGGRQVTIEEMFDKRMVGVRVPAMTEEFGFEDANVIGITRKLSSEIFRITTSTSAIESTGNHQFPILRGAGMVWVRADELKLGDCVAVPRVVCTDSYPPLMYRFLPESTWVRFHGERSHVRRSRVSEIPNIRQRHGEIESFGMGGGGFCSSTLTRIPRHLHEDIAYLCGLIASDGYFGGEGYRTISFVNTEIALHDRIQGICETWFGYSPKRHLNAKHYEALLPQGTTAKNLRDCYTSHLNNRLLCEIVRSVQRSVLELPNYMVAAWLRGMFDGDGCVRTTSSSPQVIISAWKRPTNQLVRDALLRVGIVTNLSPAASLGRDGNVVITGRESVMRFISRVYSDHPARRERLDGLVPVLQQREGSSSRLDSIPAGELLLNARRSVGMGQRSLSLQTVVEEMEDWCDQNSVDITEAFSRLKDLSESAVLWARIERIERRDAEVPVYDLCLDRHHCFIANNIVTHNCIVFIDEIDAVGRHRGAGLGGGHDEREQTLNQLLVEMDGFDSNEGVIMVAATNRPDVLDPALLRPGRFDRQIVVDWPDVRGREGILKVHTRRIPLSDEVDLGAIARGTPGMAGADLANLVNESALLAARRNHKKVSMRDFEDAKDKVMLGMERKSLVMSESERRSTAYHEAGHALVAWLLPGSDPVDKITIIPRGRALGITSYLPKEERYSRSKEDLLRSLCMLMGGRAAEFLVFSHLTTGASNDIERATALARRMVCELGMSENLGPLTFGKKEEMVFLGREIASHKDYSEQTAELIDKEVRQLVEAAYERALTLLRENLDKLDLIGKALLEREVMDGDQLERLLRGEVLEPIQTEAEKMEHENQLEEKPAKVEGPGGIEPFRPPAPRPAGA